MHIFVHILFMLVIVCSCCIKNMYHNRTVYYILFFTISLHSSKDFSMYLLFYQSGLPVHVEVSTKIIYAIIIRSVSDNLACVNLYN